MMSLGGAIHRNSYFYEMYDGNVYYEYTSRNVHYEQYQNQAAYDTILSMINNGYMYPTMYSNVLYQEYPGTVFPCEKYGSEKEKEKREYENETIMKEEKTAINVQTQDIEQYEYQENKHEPEYKKIDDTIMVETVVTDDEEEL